MRARLREFGPGLLAGAVGGLAGYWLVAYLIAHQGIWVPILPGAFAGLACGPASPAASRRRGAVLAAGMVAFIVYVQWKLWTPPFESDGSLPDYVRHLHQLPPLTLGLMALNVVLAYWWGREQGIQFARRAATAKPSQAGGDPRLD